MSVSHNFKYLIARMAFVEPARFLATFAGEGGTKALRELWNGLQRRARGEDFEPTLALAVELHGRLLVLRLPPSTEPGSTVAVAVTGGATQLRVFALEVGELEGGALPFIVELGPDGPGAASPLAARGATPHDTSLGLFAAGVVPELEAFAARVTELCAQPR